MNTPTNAKDENLDYETYFSAKRALQPSKSISGPSTQQKKAIVNRKLDFQIAQVGIHRKDSCR